MCTMAAISLYLLACLPASKQVSVNVSWDDFMKEQHISQEVEVAVDGSLTLSMYSCPSEGRQWSEAQISDQTVLQQTDHKLVMPKPETPPVPGTPGQEVWTFKALEKGTSTISMVYTHPWEGGEKEPMLTFALTVVVK
ncbi:MAG: hypothetical protein E3J75_04900 [Dehalococcoidia bacterium]|nr:MAG: hypothetical protein E3J75_04900 [Dehalococcoidia bacterium]